MWGTKPPGAESVGNACTACPGVFSGSGGRGVRQFLQDTFELELDTAVNRRAARTNTAYFYLGAVASQVPEHLLLYEISLQVPENFWFVAI